MRASGLFFRSRATPTYQVRPATRDDWPQVEWLLARARAFRLALEWRSLEECVGSPCLLLAFGSKQQIVGLLGAVQDGGPVAWLRAFALAEPCLPALLEACLPAVAAQGPTGLAFLGNEGWIVPALRQTGFERVNQVVTLKWNGRLPGQPPSAGSTDLLVRPLAESDLNGVAVVDRAAFEPMWRYGRDTLRRTLGLAAQFVVAYVGNVCVGYQFNTLQRGRGHIVRLATHPDWQGQGIGARLLAEALRFFRQARAGEVTVNTQQDNRISVRLYRRFGFEEADRPLGVWFRSLDLA